MKKLLLTLLLLPGLALGDTCGASLTGTFTSFQATKLCQVFGSAVNHSLIPSQDNTYDVGSSSFGWKSGYFDTSVLTPLLIPPGDLQIRVDADAQRLVNIGASSDTVLFQTFGDAGTTALQTFAITGSTADADDDASVCVSGGGACRDNARSGWFYSQGNEKTGGGDTEVSAGGASGSSLLLNAPASGGVIEFATQSAGTVYTIGSGASAGDITQSATQGGDFIFQTPGKWIRTASYVPTMAATPVAGTNQFLPGLNVVPTAAANTAAMTAATPVVGTEYEVFNNAGAAVRFKPGGATSINGATAGAYVEVANQGGIRCRVVGAALMHCNSTTTAAMNTPAGP